MKTTINGKKFEIKPFANLRRADLSRVYLYLADLTGTDLCGANLRKANLYGANLRKADLIGANLIGANLYLADLSRSNLYGANLYGADLTGADLSRADLRRAVGNGKEIKSMQISGWSIVWTKTDMAIGCKQLPINEWLEMPDAALAKIDSGAVDFARKYGDLIREAVKL